MTGAASAYVDVAAVADIPDGELLGVTMPDGTPVCLYNLAGGVGALGDRCTHAEYPLSDGILRADGTLECLWHGARFDCRSGAVLREPATHAVPVYAVKVQAGRVLVALDGAPEEGPR